MMHATPLERKLEGLGRRLDTIIDELNAMMQMSLSDQCGWFECFDCLGANCDCECHI
tara:strand:- start:62029 stop:62199 length:171 start_codon:yes stop_codon:yes gene_type:complete